MTWIQLYNGRALDLLNPDPAKWDIETVAHSLACLNRYTGHTVEPLSVAQHSVMVSRLIESWRFGRLAQLCGLLHDVSECAMNDLNSQWKHATEMGILFEYHETRHLKAALEGLGVAWDDYLEAEPIVKRADRIMLATERRDLMGACERTWKLEYQPVEGRVRPWIWQRAKQEFLDRWQELRDEEEVSGDGEM